MLPLENLLRLRHAIYYYVDIVHVIVVQNPTEFRPYPDIRNLEALRHLTSSCLSLPSQVTCKSLVNTEWSKSISIWVEELGRLAR